MSIQKQTFDINQAVAKSTEQVSKALSVGHVAAREVAEATMAVRLEMDDVFGAQARVTSSTQTLSGALSAQVGALNAVEGAAGGAFRAYQALASVRFNQQFGQTGLYGSIAPVFGQPLGPTGSVLSATSFGGGGGGGGGGRRWRCADRGARERETRQRERERERETRQRERNSVSGSVRVT